MKYKRWEPQKVSGKIKILKKENQFELDAMAKDIYEYLCQASVKSKKNVSTESKQKLDKVGTK